MQKSKSASTTMTRPPLSDVWDGHSDDVVRGRRESGRFVSAYGMHVISGPPGSPYRRLVLDRDWRPVGALNEWYRLRSNVGAPSTRDTYLRVLSPFFGFLLMHDLAWDAEPTLMREYTRAYLQALGCVLRRDREWDGFVVATTALAPLSPARLRFSSLRPGTCMKC